MRGKALRFVAAVILVASGSLQAQLVVEESVPAIDDPEGLYPVPRGDSTGSTRYPQQRAPAAPAAKSSVIQTRPQPSQTAEMFYQLQTLQQEIMELRGLVEEHEQSIRQLKQQRLDDYLSLDRRIAEIGQRSTAGPGSQNTAASGGSTVTPPAISTQLPQVGEEEAYRAAYGLVRDRKFDDAMTSFEQFVDQYPDGSYVPNGYYWLGELYLLKGMNAEARQSFELLLSRFADHRKVPDAMFKLAKVHHLDGRAAEARQLLERVINEYGDSAAARLASGYLQQNF